MTGSRTILRTAVPPALAAVAVLLLMHPLGAVAAPASTAPLPTSGVAFSSDSQVADGVLHSRIALAADSPAGQAHVDGTSCVARLTPGQVTDLTCPAHASTIVVTVTLDDGARTMLTLG